MTARDDIEAVAGGVIGDHVFIRGHLTVAGWTKSQCTCGHEYDNPNASEFYSHPAHVAAALAEALAPMVAGVLTEAADAVRDARENGLPTGVTGHPTHPYIEKWLRGRAEAVAEQGGGSDG
jgi:hypothetical protein